MDVEKLLQITTLFASNAEGLQFAGTPLNPDKLSMMANGLGTLYQLFYLPYQEGISSLLKESKQSEKSTFFLLINYLHLFSEAYIIMSVQTL